MWGMSCGCGNEVQYIKKKQSLIDIVKNKSKNIRTARIQDTPRCQQCTSKMRLLGIKDENFVNCQQITILMSAQECQSNLLNS
jgi:hypothetical protein